MLSKRIWKTMILCVMAMLLVASPLAVYVTYASEAAVTDTEQHSISVDVTYGYDNSAKPGRVLPVHVTFLSHDGAGFTGYADILSKEADGDIYRYSYEVSIPAQTELKQDYYIPLGVNATQLYVQLRNQKDEVVLSKRIKLNVSTDTTEVYVGVLSDTPDKLKYFDNLSINYGLINTRTFDLNTESFPDGEIGLDLFDIVLISNYRIRDLSAEQSRALMDWVKKGGVLILGTGARADDTLGRYAPELLDDMYEDPEPMTVDLGVGPDRTEPGDGIVELTCVDVSLHGANVIIPGDSASLVSSTNKENGMIVVAAYDFTDLSDYARDHSEYADNLLVRILGTKRMDNLVSETYTNDYDRYWYVQSLINTGEVGKLPPINVYILEIIAYILLVGPGLYFFLRQRKLTYMYRKGVVILSLCFAVAVYMMGNQTRFKDTFYNYATILDSSEDTVAETSFINLRNPYNRQYAVALDGSYRISPVTKTDTGMGSGSFDEDTPIKIAIDYGTDTTRVSVADAGAFAPQFFELQRSQDNESAVGFTGDIDLYENQMSGTITNNYDYKVTDAVIMVYGRMVMIGDMDAGESKDLDGSTVINIPLTNSHAIASIITGLSAYAQPDISNADYLKKYEKSNLISFYKDYYLNGYSSDARVIAFSDTPLKSGIIPDEKMERYGMTLLTSSITVNTKQDDMLYRSVLLKNPTVISGEYDADTNSIYASEPVVIEYQLGNDIELSSLTLEYVRDDLFNRTGADSVTLFSGSIAFYNHKSGYYDRMDNTKLSYTQAELKDYLSPSGSITVKYTYDNAGATQLDVVLPMLTITGRE